MEDKNDKNAVVTQPMHESLMNGHFNKVPVLLGSTSQEMLFFAGSMYNKNNTLKRFSKFVNFEISSCSIILF